jgi:hypothetical protein
MPCHLDHAIIAATSLETGADALAPRLGVDLTPGGRHPLMATHNRCTGTGGGSYLELMAPVPDAAPERPRWFELDRPAQRARIADGPRPVGWMVATPDLDATLAAARSAGLDLGEPLALSRGSYSWRVAIRPDGGLVEGGTVPVAVEWHGETHPGRDLPDHGLRYAHLTLRHPEPERLRGLLAALDVDAPVHVEQADAPGLTVTLTRPDGTAVAVT